MKKLLLLGGSRYALPVIRKAHSLGIHVITCDYLPDNIAHRHSDEYRNVSIIDKDAVLRTAEDLKIDGVMSFACDPGVVSAAYVAEKMGLPFQCSYESAVILQDKGRFRSFLTEHGFHCPHAKSYTDAKAPRKDIDFFSWPVIVKPVDSAGSKGVSKVETPDDLDAAIETAIRHSLSGRFIIEDFLEFEGFHSSTDPFTVDGKLQSVSYSDQLFDKAADNPYTPAFIIWPSTMEQKHQDNLTSEIQRLMDFLQMRTGIYNIETCVAKGGIPYIMEVSPRGGGCKIAELQELAFGWNLIENEIRKAVGLPLVPIETHPLKGFWCEMVIHAGPGQKGIFHSLSIRKEFQEKHVKVIDMSVEQGSLVKPFTGANCSLGDMFLHFDTREQLNEAISDPSEWLDIVLEK